ncbi:hypothetical protein KQI22_01685 [Kineothrix sp. MSJ-39]|uniref:hypothetical protein n=1 Tax=Kineothrix sp. MSJ-39 TaxID=2841533 RepID=UPI001C0F7346|nr:hypothetical protein [Kineothrix sp. MSJ-39]MBU5428777.1 hypothetical protein [Kineothrix sp. MSJ-39]
MNEYLKAQNKTNQIIIANNFTSNELDRFSASDFRWADNRTKQFRHRQVKKGEIYQFEFGKNYKPEMSYEHRGLVIDVKQKLLYVLPIFSYDPAKHPDVYHPTDNPTSKSDMFLLKASEFSFINHDSVLKLNDIRTVSINRILYQQNGMIAPISNTYKQIEQLVLQKYFPGFYYDYNQFQQKAVFLEKQQKENDAALKELTSKNEELKEQIAALQEQLAPNNNNQ